MSFESRVTSPERPRLSVLELAMGLDIGGAETHIVSLSRTLKGMGWEVMVASNGGRRVSDILDAGVTHVHVPLNSRSPVRIFRAYKALLDILRFHRVDLIHAHARIPAWLGTFVARRCGIPLITTYHWTFVSGFPWKLVTRPGDMTIAVSHDIKDYVVRQFGFREDRVTVIPNGIDCATFRPLDAADGDKARNLRPKFGLDEPHGPVLVYASRMTDELGRTACDVIEAASLASRDYPSLCLLIAGDGNYLGRVKEAASRANRESGRDMVRCLGFVSDMASLYQMSNLVIGMSRVVLEAMACAKPCIVAGPQGDYGPVRPEIIEELESRNFTSRGAPNPVSPETLAREIAQCLSGALSERLGQFGREYVLRAHSAESTASQVADVYLSLIGRKR